MVSLPGLQPFFRTVRCAPGGSQQKVVHKSLQAISLATVGDKKSGFTIYEGLYKCNGSNVKADI